MTKTPVNDFALDQIWRTGRSYNGWTPETVPETLIRATYDLTKMGMPSANCSPARFVFLHSTEAKERRKKVASEAEFFGAMDGASKFVRGDAIAGIRVELNLGGGSFKSQLKRADKSGATYAVVLGENEVARNEAGLKPLRTGEDQISVALDELTGVLASKLGQ